MIGLDTNIIVRYLVQDDPVQAALATSYIEENCTEENRGFINHLVLCELVWVLESCYQQSKDSIILVLETILKTNQLQVMQVEAVLSALDGFKQSSADFSDHLIASVNKFNGADATVTFDKKAAKQPLFELLREH